MLMLTLLTTKFYVIIGRFKIKSMKFVYLSRHLASLHLLYLCRYTKKIGSIQLE